ncbi:MAG TPA: hypothetical protein VJO52_16450 [Gemmatimonadaceae bacterium]|nr:hypothetical protein [Gemmatimonadaceae bacterium]
MISAPTKGWLLLAAFFIAGGAVGLAIGRTRAMPTPSNPMEPHAFVQRLSGELALDSAQRASITGILTRRQSAIDSAWRALQPTVRATMDSAQMEIVAVLRPDQRARYAQLVHAAHGGVGRP